MYPQPQLAHPLEPAPKGGGRRKSVGRAVIGLALVAYVAGMTSAITAGIINRQHSDGGHPPGPTACLAGPALTIAAAPEIAPVVAQVVRSSAAGIAPAAGCPLAQVSPQRPSDVLDALRSD